MTTIAPPRTVTLTIARQALKTALARLSGAVGVKALPVTQHVRLEVAPGSLTITATDLRAWARVTLTCEASGEAVVLLPAKRLADIVSALPPVGAVTLALSEVGATITAGRARTDITGLAVAEWPLDPKADASERTTVTAAAFLDALERVVRHASDAESRPALNAVCIEADGDGLRLSSFNGHRAARIRIPASGAFVGCSLSRFAVPVLARVFSGLADDASVSIAATDRQLFVESADASAVVGLVDEAFPSVSLSAAITSLSCERVVVCDRLLLTAAVRRVALVADEQTGRVAFTLGEEIGVQTAGDIGKSVDVVAIDERRGTDRSHDARRFGMNASYALLALDTITAPRVALAFTSPERAVLFRDADQAPDDPALVLVMPLRLLD